MDRVRVNEQSVKVVEFDIVDAEDQAVPADSLTVGELTLYDMDTFVPGSPTVGIINGRNAQDILNDNNVTIDSSGHVVYTMPAADNAMPDDVDSRAHLLRRQVWRHRAQFHFEWDDGSFNYEFEIEVVNLRSVE